MMLELMPSIDWVQTQLRDHPDELWQDGVQDYIKHASQILRGECFKLLLLSECYDAINAGVALAFFFMMSHFLSPHLFGSDHGSGQSSRFPKVHNVHVLVKASSVLEAMDEIKSISSDEPMILSPSLISEVREVIMISSERSNMEIDFVGDSEEAMPIDSLELKLA
eukprot:Gb_26199 [translate_table: standard]